MTWKVHIRAREQVNAEWPAITLWMESPDLAKRLIVPACGESNGGWMETCGRSLPAESGSERSSERVDLSDEREQRKAVPLRVGWTGGLVRPNRREKERIRVMKGSAEARADQWLDSMESIQAERLALLNAPAREPSTSPP